MGNSNSSEESHSSKFPQELPEADQNTKPLLQLDSCQKHQTTMSLRNPKYQCYDPKGFDIFQDVHHPALQIYDNILILRPLYRPG